MSTILGIETSCDETAVAIVGSGRQIYAQMLRTQLADHAPWGGVVPELAARAHLNVLDHMVAQILKAANMSWHNIDAIAATAGPGLIGGVMVGLMTAKALAQSTGKPLLAINHLEGHALTATLTNPEVTYPFLLLLASGGHTQFILVHKLGHYELLGQTLDDAVGEAFDKVAKIMGLPYPGGPALEQLAASVPPMPPKFKLPQPMQGRAGCDVSLSGLKTAVRQIVLNDDWQACDAPILAQQFHTIIGRMLVEKLHTAAADHRVKNLGVKQLVFAGGVAANQFLRGQVQNFCTQQQWAYAAPPIKLCTDNAVMIAWAGVLRFDAGQRDSLDVAAKPRWPLSELEKIT